MKTTYEQWLKQNDFSENFTTSATIVFKNESWKPGHYAYKDENGNEFPALSSKKLWEAGYKQAEKDFSDMYEAALKKVGVD